MNELKSLRRNLSETENIPAYRVFTDYTLKRLVQNKPKSLAELKKIPGINDLKADTYGFMIVRAVRRAFEKKAEEHTHRARMIANSFSHQEVKALFEAGSNIAEIALIRRIKESTVKQYLINLHQANEIDLLPWIETHVDNQDLFKGVEYFRQVQNPRLREAYEVLGLDYDTLRFCRLYVSDVSTQKEELSYAS